MKIYTLLLAILFVTTSDAQISGDEELKNDEKIFVIVEQQPKFPGGHEEMIKYISTNISYPIEARDKGDEGTIFITFVVDKSGSVRDARVLRGVSSALDKEALRVIKEMPRWQPGMQRGKKVNVQYNVPVRFTLNGNKPKKKKNKKVDPEIHIIRKN